MESCVCTALFAYDLLEKNGGDFMRKKILVAISVFAIFVVGFLGGYQVKKYLINPLII